MNKQSMLNDFIKMEMYRYERLYKKLSSEIKNLPKGSLAIDRDGNLCRCLREGKKQYKVILTSNEKDLFLDLKKRRYINKGLKVLKARIESCKNIQSAG